MNDDRAWMKTTARRGVALLALCAAAVAMPPMIRAEFPAGGAAAQTHSGGSGGHGGGGQGGQGGNHDDGGHDDGHDDTHGGGQGGAGGQQGGGNRQQRAGQGDGQGQGQGQPGSGGRPVWAREGIPEVELGRLNVARSPSHVLERAYAEALASLTPEMAEFYNLDLNAAITALSTDFDSLSYIDSPLQNLALFQDALDGTSVLTSTGQITNSTDTLMAVFLGVASDKTVPITTGTVTAVTTILGAPLSGSAAASLAADAEAVRIAVLAGHG